METDKLSELTGIDKSLFVPNPKYGEPFRPKLEEVLSAQDIEKNKDILDLSTNIDFVSQNKQLFHEGIDKFMSSEISKEDRERIDAIEFIGAEDIVPPQVTPEDCKKILIHMPQTLKKLSELKTVSYHLYDSGKHLLVVPGYDEKGNLDGSKVASIEPKNFPRKKGETYDCYSRREINDERHYAGKETQADEDDHPSRILVGVSNGQKIFPTAIPMTVSDNKEAIRLYQVHVFLHEFFHTIELLKRDPETRKKIILSTGEKEFSFQDWREAWEQLVLSETEPLCVSSYAKTYVHELTEEMKKNDPKGFTRALAEQIAETFVAYILNIISNDDKRTDFKEESFGNETLKDPNEPKNMKWILMDKLYNAKLVRKEG